MISPRPNLSVIVRTAGRDPIFLRRALESIRAQTTPPMEVVVFNAGGTPAAVDHAIEGAALLGLSVTRRHSAPLGRAAAANQAIEASRGAWIVFLDDDDTWDPRFLEETSRVIAREGPAPDFGGVVTQTMAVYERLVGDCVRQRKLEPFNPGFTAVDLAALASENRFTNNALVFRRATMAVVGPFREDLSVLEDWEFNVRLAAKFRLEVVPQLLARYHQRPSTDPAPNSQRTEHARTAVAIHNEWLRADLAAGRLGLGQLALAGESRGLGRELSRWIRWRERLHGWLRGSRR